MAITITGLPTDNDLVSGFNPKHIGFSTDVLGTPTSAKVSIYVPHLLDTFDIQITPNNNGLFSFNFQSFFRDVCKIGQDYFEYSLPSPDISTPSNALLIDSELNTLLQFALIIYEGTTVLDSTVLSPSEIYFTNGSTQVLNSEIVTEHSNTSNNTNPFVIPFTVGDIAPVWQGHPFSFQFDLYTVTSTSVLVGGNGLFTKAISGADENRTMRVFLIDKDGNELTGINDNTNNLVEVTPLFGAFKWVQFPIEYRVPSCPDESKYIRFLNSKGGVSYWLFEDSYTEERTRQNKKDIVRNFTGLEYAKSRLVSLGNDTNEVLIVSQTTSKGYENEILNDLIQSPVVELWISGDKWQRIDLLSHSGSNKSKQVSAQYSFSFNLGKLYNQSI